MFSSSDGKVLEGQKGSVVGAAPVFNEDSNPAIPSHINDFPGLSVMQNAQ
jgi:hypothetical protein